MHSSRNIGRLINPTSARFLKEGRRLYVGVPQVYVAFTRLVILIGLAMVLIGLFSGGTGLVGVFGATWWEFFGVLVFFSGAWSHYLFDFVDFDLKEHFYRRRCGSWPKRRTYRGKLTDIDAVVLTRETIYGGGMGPETFFLRLHWKDQREPPTGLAEIYIRGSAGSIHDMTGMASIPASFVFGIEKGKEFSAALGVPLYNSTGYVAPQQPPSQPHPHAPMHQPQPRPQSPRQWP